MTTPVERQDTRLMREMFSKIAPKYDFITRVISYGMDRRWKRLAVRRADLPENSLVLDLASGTGDLSRLVQQRSPRIRSVAVDITENMLRLALAQGLKEAACADATNLPFPDASFDCVFIGYGLRNFPNLSIAVREIERVTKPGGIMVSLDFFLPRNLHFSPAVSWISVCAGRVLGHFAARQAAHLHLYPGLDTQLHFRERFFFAASTRGLRTSGRPRVCFWRHRHALGSKAIILNYASSRNRVEARL